GVRDLEHVEDPHVDLLVELRQYPGHPDEADLPRVTQRERLAQRTLGVELLTGQAAVELDYVEMVGAHEAQAVLDSLSNVVCSMHVLGTLRGPGHAPDLGREDVLVAAVCDRCADELLATPVVDRGVDEVDALVEDRVQQRAGFLVAQLRAT